MATSLTISQFKVDLAQLEDAIGTIRTQAATIDTNCTEIKDALSEVPGAWNSPAEQLTFAPVAQACTTQINNLTDLLAEMIQRMQDAYQTYLAAEQANFKNFQ